MFKLDFAGVVKGFSPTRDGEKTYLKIGALDTRNIELQPGQTVGNVNLECPNNLVDGIGINVKVQVSCILEIVVQEWTDPQNRNAKTKFYDHYNFRATKIHVIK
jgi:hypothetical protein